MQIRLYYVLNYHDTFSYRGFFFNRMQGKYNEKSLLLCRIIENLVIFAVFNLIWKFLEKEPHITECYSWRASLRGCVKFPEGETYNFIAVLKGMRGALCNCMPMWVHWFSVYVRLFRNRCISVSFAWTLLFGTAFESLRAAVFYKNNKYCGPEEFFRATGNWFSQKLSFYVNIYECIGC